MATAEVTIPGPTQKGATERGSKEPKYSKFTQQELPAWRPLLTPKVVIALFFGVGIVFIPIGAACIAAAISVVEVVKRYDDQCIQAPSNLLREEQLMAMNGTGNVCTVTVEIPKDMKPPIFVYYELNNFYQNHRRYVKSRSDTQLLGLASATTTDCEPELSLDGNTSLPINPCGLIAWSYFNDTYQVAAKPAGGALSVVPVDEKGIAWPSDRNKKFGSYNATNFNTNPALRGGGTIVGPINEDEHFIVWMRTAALPNFRKLWGRISQPIAAGTTVTITIQNRYNTYRFDGQKKIVLSTTSWLGGKNNFLGVGYLVVGGASFLFGSMFFVIQWKFPRKLGDVKYLSWNHRVYPTPAGA